MEQKGKAVVKTCADYHEKKHKLKFCQEHFFGLAPEVAHCMDYYCSTCC